MRTSKFVWAVAWNVSWSANTIPMTRAIVPVAKGRRPEGNLLEVVNFGRSFLAGSMQLKRGTAWGDMTKSCEREREAGS